MWARNRRDGLATSISQRPPVTLQYVDLANRGVLYTFHANANISADPAVVDRVWQGMPEAERQQIATATEFLWSSTSARSWLKAGDPTATSPFAASQLGQSKSSALVPVEHRSSQTRRRGGVAAQTSTFRHPTIGDLS